VRFPGKPWIRLAGLAWLALARPALPAPAAPPLELRIEGLAAPLEKNVRAILTLARENAASTPARIQLAERRAPEEIRTALEPFGYYRVQATGGVRREGDNWVARYRVDPGPPIKLSEVNVALGGDALHEPEMRELVEKFPLKTGDVLNHPAYEKGKGAIQGRAAELGFFDARLSRHEILVDLKAYTARIELKLDSGRRYTFGDVSFSHTPLNDDLLQRFVRFKPGDPYRASLLFALQRSLLNSGYFSKVDVDPAPEHARDGSVPIGIDLGMAPRHRVDLGAGFGTDTGPRVTLGYRNRWLNSYGHTFQASTRLSPIWYDLYALYAIPLANPDQDQLAFTARTGVEDTVAGYSRLLTGGIRHSTTRWGLREVLALDFQYENFDLPGATPSQSEVLAIPSLNYTWLESDDPVFATEGFRLDGNLAGAIDGFVSELSFVRLRLTARGLYSFNEDNRLIVRGQAAVLATDDFDRLPITQRLYAGGDQSVRGYRFNEIAPRDAAGNLIGGRHLFVGSLEYNRTVWGNWGMALFSDLGYVFNDAPEEVRVGVGTGVRWRSPVGPVRLDVGVPLSKSLDPFQVHLILGPDL
jgi:translocation and assembly module TamA